MRRIDPRRITTRARLHVLLLLAGAGLVAVLALQAWRSWSLEHGLRTAELERSALAAERLLQVGVASPVAFAEVDAALRAVVRGGNVEVGDVGWLRLEHSPADHDLIVDDRIHRATLEEFARCNAASARAAFDELLAVPLIAVTRAQAVAAAAWQAARSGDAERRAKLAAELGERVAELTPGDLARPVVARVVASALRLVPAGAPAPAWADRLAPYLPEDVFAGLPDAAQWAAEHRRGAARRALLRSVGDAWAATGGAASGLAATSVTHLLWWQPRGDGAHDAAWLAPREVVGAVRAAGRRGALAEWPFFVEPDFAGDTEVAFAGVPGLRGVVPAAGAAATSPWLLPVASAIVLLAFGFAVGQQLRAARGEVLAVRTQADFLTTVTHELKTPLAAIRLLAEMLAEGRAVGKETEYYRMLAGEAGRLSLLIENVLDLGRLERGQRAYDLRDVDVADVLGEVVAMFTPLAARDGIELRWRDELGSVRARLDRGAFVQALVAVLDNARKYGASGGAIEIVSRGDGDAFAVDVRDWGPGVPADERERVSERFVRGSAHAHGSTPGIGIGLYLARSIARRLHGELACLAPPDGGPGACFRFSFRLTALPVEKA